MRFQFLIEYTTNAHSTAGGHTVPCVTGSCWYFSNEFKMTAIKDRSPSICHRDTSFLIKSFQRRLNWIELKHDVTTHLIEYNERKVSEWEVDRKSTPSPYCNHLSQSDILSLKLACWCFFLYFLLPCFVINKIIQNRITQFQCPNWFRTYKTSDLDWLVTLANFAIHITITMMMTIRNSLSIDLFFF